MRATVRSGRRNASKVSSELTVYAGKKFKLCSLELGELQEFELAGSTHQRLRLVRTSIRSFKPVSTYFRQWDLASGTLERHEQESNQPISNKSENNYTARLNPKLDNHTLKTLNPESLTIKSTRDPP